MFFLLPYYVDDKTLLPMTERMEESTVACQERKGHIMLPGRQILASKHFCAGTRAGSEGYDTLWINPKRGETLLKKSCLADRLPLGISGCNRSQQANGYYGKKREGFSAKTHEEVHLVNVTCRLSAKPIDLAS
jgi:hypothetical protein